MAVPAGTRTPVSVHSHGLCRMKRHHSAVHAVQQCNHGKARVWPLGDTCVHGHHYHVKEQDAPERRGGRANRQAQKNARLYIVQACTSPMVLHTQPAPTHNKHETDKFAKTPNSPCNTTLHTSFAAMSHAPRATSRCGCVRTLDRGHGEIGGHISEGRVEPGVRICSM